MKISIGECEGASSGKGHKEDRIRGVVRPGKVERATEDGVTSAAAKHKEEEVEGFSIIVENVPVESTA